MAGLLDWPQVTFASKIEQVDGRLQVTREIDGGLQTLAFNTPGLVTCDLRLNTPRFATLPNIMKAKKRPLEEIQFSTFNIDTSKGISIVNHEEPTKRQGGVKVESVDDLIKKLKSEAKVI